MRESIGNLFDVRAHWIVIPTNGKTYYPSGYAVMGAGVALQAKNRCSGIEKVLGVRLSVDGNHVHLLGIWNHKLVFSFPTKDHYKDGSPLDLVLQSCKELRHYFLKAAVKPDVVLLPQVGCGYGGLQWETIKEDVAKELPEDNFVVLGLGPSLGRS